MYAIKQIKICAEYRDMLPRPRLDLSGTPGLRPIGLSPGSWQTSLGLGSMSRYSAQILIFILKDFGNLIYTRYFLSSFDIDEQIFTTRQDTYTIFDYGIDSFVWNKVSKSISPAPFRQRILSREIRVNLTAFLTFKLKNIESIN